MRLDDKFIRYDDASERISREEVRFFNRIQKVARKQFLCRQKGKTPRRKIRWLITNGRVPN